MAFWLFCRPLNADIFLGIAWIELKIAKIAQVNQLFQLLNFRVYIRATTSIG